MPAPSFEVVMNFGHTLDSSVIEQGLLMLNPDIHFDMGTKHGQWHPFQESRQGVFHNGRHICSMDRGLVPEYKQWDMKAVDVPVHISQMQDEDARVRFEVVSPQTPGYIDLYVNTSLGKVEECYIRKDGALVRLQVFKRKTIPHKVVLVGWRHTFERLLQENIPGITRQSLAKQFGVDMLKYPVGPPEEVIAALVAE